MRPRRTHHMARVGRKQASDQPPGADCGRLLARSVAEARRLHGKTAGRLLAAPQYISRLRIAEAAKTEGATRAERADGRYEPNRGGALKSFGAGSMSGGGAAATDDPLAKGMGGEGRTSSAVIGGIGSGNNIGGGVVGTASGKSNIGSNGGGGGRSFPKTSLLDAGGGTDGNGERGDRGHSNFETVGSRLRPLRFEPPSSAWSARDMGRPDDSAKRCAWETTSSFNLMSSSR
mmetsp:Transcript_33556/g.97684  ORF Transcript_33556/g.97684 Transcript_33556/m.97684 type:complete len:232 (+) Transcript_33556:108-803(+)